MCSFPGTGRVSSHSDDRSGSRTACRPVGVLWSRRSHVVLPGALLQRGQWLPGGTGARPEGRGAQPGGLPQPGAVRDARG